MFKVQIGSKMTQVLVLPTESECVALATVLQNPRSTHLKVHVELGVVSRWHVEGLDEESTGGGLLLSQQGTPTGGTNDTTDTEHETTSSCNTQHLNHSTWHKTIL